MEPMSPEKTSFSVETATIDDMETASRLQFEAIWPASPVDRAIYPLGMTDTALAAATATKKRKFGSGNVEYKKVVVSLDGGDTESETVAFARWYVWAEDRDASDWDKPYTFSPEEGLAPGDMNLTAAEIIYGTLYDAKKRGTGGKRHLCPFSWVLIDAEHGLIGDKDYYELVNTVANEGASPIIRVPCAEEWMIKRALDAGAHGVLTPMCHTAEDAAKIVRYSKYPPWGTRGYGPVFAFHSLPGLGPGDPAYDEGAQMELIVAVQIESGQGVENAEKIASVDGVDVLLVGPFDLAKQMDVQPGGPEHEAAIQKVLKAAHGVGKTAAIFCLSGAQARLRVQQGFDMVSVSTDSTVVGEAMVQHLGTANGTLTPGIASSYKSSNMSL
ncbi:hypothetical protein SBRCBS47491_007506 [Sporothrix bragantina]|uniref:HpcH/HpaI aldolase/citrate lyase domain-containing protein n=1 Tax=Sporothrix bragantina TaxID=671064 RepID=A0ABP0CF18_9PEZI